MDLLSLFGIIIGLGAILLGNSFEGGSLDSLVNGPALIIVVGGTLGAIFLQTPPKTFLHSLRILNYVLFPKRVNLKSIINKIVDWSALARKEGLLGLENLITDERDSFARKGLQLLVDGNEPDVIRSVMDVELLAKEDKDLRAARVFEAMGGFSPTIGIIGAVMGLIHVLQNLADPGKLGGGIATAFVATIYGVGLANLLFIPVANKLKAQTRVISQSRELMIEGISGIAEGENPRNIETKLDGFLD